MNAVEVQFYGDEKGNDGGLTDFLAEAATDCATRLSFGFSRSRPRLQASPEPSRCNTRVDRERWKEGKSKKGPTQSRKTLNKD